MPWCSCDITVISRMIACKICSWNVWFFNIGGLLLIANQWFQSGFMNCGQPWWRHQMETFSALLAICAGNSPVPGEFPTQRPVTRSFDVFLDLHLNKQLSKQSRGWWFETPSGSLWCQCNDIGYSNCDTTWKNISNDTVSHLWISHPCGERS